MNRRTRLRQILNAAGIVILPRAPGQALAGETIERIARTDAEWCKLLTPDQDEVLSQEGTERPFTSPQPTEIYRHVRLCCLVSNCSLRDSSSIAEPAGRVFTMCFPDTSNSRRISSWACRVPSITALVAADTTAMSSRMARRRLACAIAITASRCGLLPARLDPPNTCPTFFSDRMPLAAVTPPDRRQAP